MWRSIASSVSLTTLSAVYLLTCSNAFGQSLSLTRVATGLSNPVYATAAPGNANSLYIVEKTGNIRVMNLTTGTINATSFLTSAQLSAGTGLLTSGEQGLLGMAFDPNFQVNRRFYVNYIDGASNIRVRSFTSSNGLTTDAGSQAEIIQIGHPTNTNHNGGWIDFGPDNHLYIATGDGGGANDVPNNAQNLNSLLGKMLRITPGTTSAGGYTNPVSNPFLNDGNANTRGEIWAYGLRNPWRNSFDSLTGDLYIADVGQAQREEINVQLSTSSGGENYGWRVREGTISTGLTGQPGTGPASAPIYDYEHGVGPFEGRSVTGGYVYRGPIAGLQGQYFFGDFVSQRLFSLSFDGSNPASFDGTNFTSLIDWTDTVDIDVGSLGGISSFAEDASGNLYLINLGGSVYRFTSGTIPEPSATMVLGVIGLTTLLVRRRRMRTIH